MAQLMAMETTGMMTSFDWVDSSVVADIDIDKTFSTTFSAPQNSSLQLKRLTRQAVEDHRDVDPLPYMYSKEVSTKAELEQSAVSRFIKEIRGCSSNTSQQCHDLCQIFCIRQKHSYARLYITRELFDQLLSAYSVFSRIWDFVLPFSFKIKESDIGHAPFRFRQLGSNNVSSGLLGSFGKLNLFCAAYSCVCSPTTECAYGFRYVELNHRTVGKRENPDYDAWSVRQSAIYQQYDSKYDRITFILISPSGTARKSLEGAVQRAGSKQKKLNAFDLHRIIISTLHDNWRQYIRNLEGLMMQQVL
jgi:hypothetical protein